VTIPCNPAANIASLKLSRIKGENEMLGLGLIGTIIVIVVVVWIVRRV